MPTGIAILFVMGFIAIGWIGTLLAVWLWRKFRGNVTETSLATPEPGKEEDGEEFNAVVGRSYPIKGPFAASFRVDELDGEEELAFGTLVIELPIGSQVVSIQRSPEKYFESFFCITYTDGGRSWKTLTCWDWAADEVEWPEFDNAEISVLEIEAIVPDFFPDRAIND